MSDQKNTKLYEALQQECEETITALVSLVRQLNSGATDEETVKMAGIFFGVFNDREEGVDRELPQSVRAFCENFLGGALDRMDIHAWNSSLLSPLAWMILSGVYEACGGEAGGVIATIENLCTQSEYAEFRLRYGLAGEAEEDTKSERDEMAAYKIARYLASPATDEKIREKLGAALYELSSMTSLTVDHPALAERAASIMFESITDESEAHVRREYEDILAMLDELPDLPEKGGE